MKRTQKLRALRLQDFVALTLLDENGYREMAPSDWATPTGN